MQLSKWIQLRVEKHSNKWNEIEAKLIEINRAELIPEAKAIYQEHYFKLPEFRLPELKIKSKEVEAERQPTQQVKTKRVYPVRRNVLINSSLWEKAKATGSASELINSLLKAHFTEESE